MIQLDIKNKNLKEAMEVVMAVASENNPVHGRRMDLLKMRRGSQDQSQWLYKLETAMELKMGRMYQRIYDCSPFSGVS